MHAETMDAQAVHAFLLDEIRRALHPDDAPPDGDTSFSAMGLDSMTQVTLIGRLEEYLGLELDPTLAYDYPTINALAGKLEALLAQG